MTTTQDHNWTSPGYRAIPNWAGYEMSPCLEVRSLPRQVPCKGGAMRYTKSKLLKTSKDGRITLSQDGKTARFHVYKQLYPAVFPEFCDTQLWCRAGHPLVPPINPDMFGSLAGIMEPRVARWGTGHRICLWCSTPPDVFESDNTYSTAYGVAIPDGYTGLPAQPKLRGLDATQFAEIEWDDAGFCVTTRP